MLCYEYQRRYVQMYRFAMKAYISGKKANTENCLLLKVLDKWEKHGL